MNRRKFIKTTEILGAAALSPLSGFTRAAKPKFKMGLQLFSIYEDMTSNTIATLKAVKAMGYEDFETFGFDGDQGTFYGFKSSEFRNILDDLQLSATSGHFGFAPFLDRPEEELKRFTRES